MTGGPDATDSTGAGGVFGDAPLFFPLTPFDRQDRVDPEMLREHVGQGIAAAPGGVFAACGTGELHALSGAEHAEVLRTVVGEVGGGVPVFAGAGGPLGLVHEQVRNADEAGADGILLLPPYLVSAPVGGLVTWVREIAGRTTLPVIVYQRANAILTPEAIVELAGVGNVVGLKDGVGDIELMQRIVLAVKAAAPGPFSFFNGLPTAELTAPAYRAIGVAPYSSAVFCFAPRLSKAFYAGLAADDHATTEWLLERFFLPFVSLRNEVPGYAVTLVKAATRLRGLDVGTVRAPLVDLVPHHERRLRDLLDVLDGLGL